MTASGTAGFFAWSHSDQGSLDIVGQTLSNPTWTDDFALNLLNEVDSLTRPGSTPDSRHSRHSRLFFGSLLPRPAA